MNKLAIAIFNPDLRKCLLTQETNFFSLKIHSLTTLLLQIRALRDSSCPIAQLKRRNCRRRGWMAGLRKVAPEKKALPCNAQSIFNRSEDHNSLAKSKMYTNLSAIVVTESWLTSDMDSCRQFAPTCFSSP